MSSAVRDRPRTAAAPLPRRRRRPDLLVLLPPGLLAVLGGLLLLRRPSLWYDELYTAAVAPLPLSRLVEAVRTGEGTAPYLLDVPPSYSAPYYVVVHGWLALTGLPPGELPLRGLSLIAAVLGVGVLTAAVVRLAGRAVGVSAGLLVATNPLVLEYAVEARGYGLALLATSVAALGLVRWLDGGRLWLWGLGALTAGLAHWFALPVVAGLALAAVLLRRRAATGLVAVTAVAALPSLALVAQALRVDDGGTTTGWIRDTGGAVPLLALQAWTAGSGLLLVGLLLAAVAAAARRPGALTVVGACWLAVPLLVVTAAELVRPVFVPRYLLPALVGLAVLAAPVVRLRAGRLAVAGLLLLSLLAAAPLVDRGPREDARGAVAALDARWSGEPVVAVDRRAALALEQYAGPSRAALLLPPDDAPPAADAVWLLRQADGRGRIRRSDDDVLLRQAGLSVVDERLFPGTSSGLLLQRWER